MYMVQLRKGTGCNKQSEKARRLKLWNGKAFRNLRNQSRLTSAWKHKEEELQLHIELASTDR